MIIFSQSSHITRANQHNYPIITIYKNGIVYISTAFMEASGITVNDRISFGVIEANKEKPNLYLFVDNVDGFVIKVKKAHKNGGAFSAIAFAKYLKIGTVLRLKYVKKTKSEKDEMIILEAI